MKTILLLIALLSSVLSVQQPASLKETASNHLNQIQQAEKLEGFAGLKFDQDYESVLLQLSSKYGKPIKKTLDELMYENEMFGGRKASVIKLHFHNRKLYSGNIYFIPDADPQILSLYTQLKEDLINKWASPSISAESYKSPYEKGDGHETTAIRGGYATIGAAWYFPTSSSNAEDASESIVLWVDSKMWVQLSYYGGESWKLAEAENDKKINEDF